MKGTTPAMAMDFVIALSRSGTPLLAAFSNHHSLANQCPTYKLAIKREIFENLIQSNL